MFGIGADVFAFRWIVFFFFFYFLFIVAATEYTEMILHCWIGLAMLLHLVYSLFCSLTIPLRMHVCFGWLSYEGERVCMCACIQIHTKWLLQNINFWWRTKQTLTIYPPFMCVRFYAHFRCDKTFNITRKQ